MDSLLGTRLGLLRFRQQPNCHRASMSRFWRERNDLGASRSGFITCRVVIERPQFLRQQQLHFIHESVVGGPQASGAGSCHLGGLGIDGSKVGTPLRPRSRLTRKDGSSLSL